MPVHRRISKIGGSLGILIPRDIAESMGVREKSKVSLSTVGRHMVVEPEDDTMSETSFRRSLAIVLRRYGKAFKMLADFDAGRAARPKQK